MFERFTERARQSVALAQEEARKLNHNYIGTEHILLGLIREEEGLAARVLSELGIEYDEVYKFNSATASPNKFTATEPLPFTPKAKKLYELALREALSLGHNYIGTEHILLGLIRSDGVSSTILFDHYHYTPDEIRNEVIKILLGPGGAGRRAQKEQLAEQRKNREEKAREQLWTPAKTEEENSKEDGPTELAVSSVRGQVITISGDLTLEVDRDIYGRLNILIKNPSGLPVQISEK